MRTKEEIKIEEIKIEIARLEEKLKGVAYEDPLWNQLNAKLWVLKWALTGER